MAQSRPKLDDPFGAFCTDTEAYQTCQLSYLVAGRCDVTGLPDELSNEICSK